MKFSPTIALFVSVAGVSFPPYPAYSGYPYPPQYPSYPGYSSYPSYPSYPGYGYPSYPSYPGYPGYTGYPGYPPYPGYPQPVTPAPTPQGSTSASSETPAQALAGKPPSQQLQIMKCRTAQNCEKCRTLNCYWDTSGAITHRCVALGLETTSATVSQGTSASLGPCTVFGQPGALGVNWVAVEAMGVPVPNLQGQSDAQLYQWLSSLGPAYQPDSPAVNYPAAPAFQQLLPNAGVAYSIGQIPSTTPWVSWFDNLCAETGVGGIPPPGYTPPPVAPVPVPVPPPAIPPAYPGSYPNYPPSYSNADSYSGGYPGSYPGSVGYPGSGSYPGSVYPGSVGYPGGSVSSYSTSPSGSVTQVVTATTQTTG